MMKYSLYTVLYLFVSPLTIHITTFKVGVPHLNQSLWSPFVVTNEAFGGGIPTFFGVGTIFIIYYSTVYGSLLPCLLISPLSQGGDYLPPKSPSDLLSFCAKSPASNKWSCGICGQFSHVGRHQVRNHVESKHFPTTFQYQCQYCDKICNTKKGLEVHLSERHRN